MNQSPTTDIGSPSPLWFPEMQDDYCMGAKVGRHHRSSGVIAGRSCSVVTTKHAAATTNNVSPRPGSNARSNTCTGSTGTSLTQSCSTTHEDDDNDLEGEEESKANDNGDAQMEEEDVTQGSFLERILQLRFLFVRTPTADNQHHHQSASKGQSFLSDRSIVLDDISDDGVGETKDQLDDEAAGKLDDEKDWDHRRANSGVIVNDLFSSLNSLLEALANSSRKG